MDKSKQNGVFPRSNR